MNFITRLLPRRHEILDEEPGIVFSIPMFNHKGGADSVKIHNVPDVDSPPRGGSSFSMQAGELLRIDRGRITVVEATGASLPYGTKSGWGD